MQIQISNISVALTGDQNDAFAMAAAAAGVKNSQINRTYVVKKSVDARKKNSIKLTYTIGLDLACCVDVTAVPNAKLLQPTKLNFVRGSRPLSSRPVVVGFGPAGIFCALYLAKNGYRPIVLERGYDVDSRQAAVQAFASGGAFNPNSNVQFGEGGAGTFSDGKLTTRINDPLCDAVMQDLVAAGAPAEILTLAKPHIGTDKLRLVIKNLRQQLLDLGGEIQFGTTLNAIYKKNDTVCGVATTAGDITTDVVVLATGHSARDTYRALFEQGVQMQPKVFSVGARIEHLQRDVDYALYGDYANHPLLPKGEYQLSWRDKTAGRGVYTFCMCPGGVVVPAQSIAETVVTNGMSYHSRDGVNANSALVVNVGPDDYGTHPLDGINFAEQIERAAYKQCGYKAPAQTVGSFLGSKTAIGAVSPSYSLGVTDYDIAKILPPQVTSFMKTGLEQMGKKQANFRQLSAVLTAPETRTSAPLRITRDSETGVSVNTGGLYPCGEGSGYAGGITSAAVDGIKTAMHIVARS